LQKRLYRGVYPLYGFINVELKGSDSLRCVIRHVAVEYLGDSWSKDNPQYEAIAPTGVHFDEGLHTILGFTQRDLLDRINYLVPCNEGCDQPGGAGL
jgi:hypothetical protein